MKNDPPIKNFKEGRVQCDIWYNKDDRNPYSIDFYRSYRDANGEWKKARNFSPEDQPDLRRASEMAETHVKLHTRRLGREEKDSEVTAKHLTAKGTDLERARGNAADIRQAKAPVKNLDRER